MEKIELLKKLIAHLDETCPKGNESYKYIGTGNPNANILIIGKEAAHEPGTTAFNHEIMPNFNYWKSEQVFNQKNVSSIHEKYVYSPLYPYKGQVLKINNCKNFGTSRTWYNYQKIYNLITGNDNNQQINFHEGVFITEVNSTPSKKTYNANTESIEYRKKCFLTSEFIGSFPIVIIGGVRYFEINDTKNEIEDIFNVKFEEQKFAAGNKKQPYWIHWNNDKTKLLINTYQLSMGISDALLKEIVDVIKESNLLGK
jgi:hypothetical protein